MRRQNRFHHRPRFYRPWKGGWIWLIILGFIFSGGNNHWWPGILIVIGFFMIFGSLFREERPHEPRHIPPVDEAPPPAWSKPDPAPQAPLQFPGILPATCPSCGAPVDASQVKWTGSHSAACAYCGSNLQTKKG